MCLRAATYRVFIYFLDYDFRLVCEVKVSLSHRAVTLNNSSDAACRIVDHTHNISNLFIFVDLFEI